MSHNFETEDARIAAAKVAGRNIAAYEIKSGFTEPRNWDKDDVQNARAFSHLAAVGFSRAGTRMYSQVFVDAYRAEFIRLRLECLRTQLRREQISYGELVELQGLAEHIQPGDVELLEAAGVPEDIPENDRTKPVYWVGYHYASLLKMGEDTGKTYQQVADECATIATQFPSQNDTEVIDSFYENNE
jgi:hypothetical protein